MSSRFGRFVPQSTIMARMDRKDLRFQAAARRQAALRAGGLAWEIFPYASVEIVREVAIVPASIDTERPVVDVALVKKTGRAA